MLSQAVEDYLKTIYKLHSGGAVTTTEIARSLGVSSASVTNMVKKLAQSGFLTHQSYRGVVLTAAGEKIALEIIRHHRLLETYLREIMGYGWEQMHAEAEHLEHHISEEFEDRLDEMLGYPTHDPHGDPIPTRDGTIIPTDGSPIFGFAEGDRIRIVRVPDDDPELLHRLEHANLLPGAEVGILTHSGVEMTISVMNQDRSLSLSRDTAIGIIGDRIGSAIME
jgi:DtxR family Mn-dependent transcriptional regulator